MEIRNEKGYSLLIVLLVVTFIMIISATFVTASVSNAKQEKTVDTNNLAVVAAEMGVDYYKTAMLNEFNYRRNELLTAAQSKINALITSSDFANKDKNAELQRISNEIGGMLEEFLQKKINLLLIQPEETIINGDTKYMRNDLSVEKIDMIIEEEEEEVVVNGEVIVNGKVTGSSTNDNPRELEFKLKFDLLDFSKINLDIDVVEGIPIIDFDNPVDGATVCNSHNQTSSECLFKNLEGSTVYYENGYIDKSTNNKDFKNSNVYVNGDIDVQNMNGMANVYINVSGKFIAQNFQSKFGINNSTIVVGTSLEGQNILATNSTILTKDDFKAQELTVTGSSKVCVGGRLKGKDELKNEKPVDLKIIEDSEVYLITGQGHNYNLKNSEKGPVILSVEEYKEKCLGGMVNIPAIDDDWNDPIIDVVY